MTLSLAFLAPDIVKAAIEGGLPPRRLAMRKFCAGNIDRLRN
jgi:hypothetical protein